MARQKLTCTAEQASQTVSSLPESVAQSVVFVGDGIEFEKTDLKAVSAALTAAGAQPTTPTTEK